MEHGKISACQIQYGYIFLAFPSRKPSRQIHRRNTICSCYMYHFILYEMEEFCQIQLFHKNHLLLYIMKISY